MNMNKEQKKQIIIFSGFNQRAIIAFIRTLVQSDVDFKIIAKSKNDPILKTAYKKDVIAIRNKVELNLDDILNALQKVVRESKYKEFIIPPSTEALNRFILKHRDKFSEIGFEMPLVEEHIYELVSDKYSFGDLCVKQGIKCPQELDFEPISYPVVAKPIKYLSSTGDSISPIIITSPFEYNGFKNKYNLSEFYIQEYIDGPSYYLLYYFHRNGTIYKYSQENIIQQHGGKSVVAANSSDLHKHKISYTYEKLFKSINFFGLVMVELKFYNDHFYMIEANPRFWGPSQLFVDSNQNLFLPLLDDFGIKPLKGSDINNPLTTISKYFWFGGVLDTIASNEKLKFYRGNLSDFTEEIPGWLGHDIYRRHDTSDIFYEEITQ